MRIKIKREAAKITAGIPTINLRRHIRRATSMWRSEDAIIHHQSVICP